MDGWQQVIGKVHKKEINWKSSEWFNAQADMLGFLSKNPNDDDD